MRAVGWIAVIGVIASFAAAGAAHAGDEDSAALVARLPLDRDEGARAADGVDVETKLAALGPSAVHDLVRELHLELRGREEQTFTDSGKSRRLAVIRALGRIDCEPATRALIEVVRAYGDFTNLCEAAVRALRPRKLNDSEIERLLTSASPVGVLFALQKAGAIDEASPLRAASMQVFQIESARRQFRNSYGYPIAGDDLLWQVRLAAGRAMGIDMVPDMRRRAYAVVGDLDAVSRGDLDGRGPPLMVYGMPAPEADVFAAIGRLAELGEPVRDVVENAWKTAHGDFATILDFVLLALGDKNRVPSVAATVTDSPRPSLRICAAFALRQARDPRARAAWWKALGDPFHRPGGGCIPVPGDGEACPVRSIAADALIELGEDAKVVREKERAR